MKKTLSAILCIVILITSIAMCSCASSQNKELEDIPSGQKLVLNETTLKITEKFEVMAAKNGYVSGANVKIEISGYPKQLSYFDSVITFIWNYEYLSDSGEYLPASYTANVSLDPEGKGSFKETVEFTGVRNVRNVELIINSAGYAIRK